MPEKYAIFKTLLGWCGIVYGNYGIIKLYLPENNKQKLKNKIIGAYKGIGDDSKKIKEIIKQISDYFIGKNSPFNFPVDIRTVSGFEEKVYRETINIPFGEVKTYKWLAEKSSVPHGSRAVGNALSKNPIPLVIPCHRVIRSNGTLGGFTAPAGLSLKKKMLSIEGHKITT